MWLFDHLSLGKRSVKFSELVWVVHIYGEKIVASAVCFKDSQFSNLMAKNTTHTHICQHCPHLKNFLEFKFLMARRNPTTKSSSYTRCNFIMILLLSGIIIIDTSYPKQSKELYCPQSEVGGATPVKRGKSQSAEEQRETHFLNRAKQSNQTASADVSQLKLALRT